MHRSGHSTVALRAFVVFDICLMTHAQTSSSSGNVEGWVYDTQAAPVAGGQIEVRNQQTGLTRSAEANDRGYYRIGDLPVGLYTVGVSHTGFAEFQHKGVTVSLGATVRIDAHLQLAS